MKATPDDSSTTRLSLLDRVACWAGIWALRRLYGECDTDVLEDYPGENLSCIGCDATRMIKGMKEIIHG